MKPYLLFPLSFLALNGKAMPAKPADGSPEKRPNLLIVMADQWRGRALGFLGTEPVLTPNLDRFAQNGIVLNQAVSGYPVSSPARGMLMTGAYPHVNGVISNCNSRTSEQGVELRADIVCWSDVLKNEGYHTGYIGKWHLDKPERPFVDCANNKGNIAWNEWCKPSRRHGFDFWTAYGTYDQHLRPMYWNTNSSRDEFYYVDKWGPEYEADLAIEFIRSNAAQPNPFALMVSMNPPHTGYNLVPNRYKKLYKEANADSIIAHWPNAAGLKPKFKQYLRSSLLDYYACMSGVDEQFGRIIEALRVSGELDNTIVVFTSDHGDMMGIHDHIGKNIFYEEAMRIPMIVAYGTQLKPRIDHNLLISLEDLYPTLLSMLKLGDKIPASVQTRDLSAAIAGSKRNLPTEQLYLFYSEGEGELMTTQNGWRGIRNLRYTYAQKAENGRIIEHQLFDRKTDPYQLHNIASEEPKLVEKISRILYARLLTIGDKWIENK